MGTESSTWEETWNSALNLFRQGSTEAAEQILQRLAEGADENDCRLIDVLCLLAQAIHKQHASNELWPAEEAALGRALQVSIRLCGGESKKTTRIRRLFGNSLHTAGRSDEALEHVLELVKQAHGEGYLLAHELNGLADIYLALRRYDEAIDVFRRSQMISTGRHEFTDLLVEFGLGRALLGAGRTGEAIAALQQAYDRCTRLCGAEGRRTNELRDWLERAQRMSGLTK